MSHKEGEFYLNLIFYLASDLFVRLKCRNIVRHRRKVHRGCELMRKRVSFDSVERWGQDSSDSLTMIRVCSKTRIRCSYVADSLFFGFWKRALFSVDHYDSPVFLTSTLGFKARVDPSLACFLASMQWIPKIHVSCNTCWRFGSQHGRR